MCVCVCSDGSSVSVTESRKDHSHTNANANNRIQVCECVCACACVLACMCVYVCMCMHHCSYVHAQKWLPLFLPIIYCCWVCFFLFFFSGCDVNLCEPVGNVTPLHVATNMHSDISLFRPMLQLLLRGRCILNWRAFSTLETPLYRSLGLEKVNHYGYAHMCIMCFCLLSVLCVCVCVCVCVTVVSFVVVLFLGGQDTIISATQVLLDIS